VLDGFRVRGRLTVAAIVAAVFAPQLLHAAGWDTVRIWTFTVAAAFLACWAAAETCKRRGAVSPAVPLVALAALVVNIVTATPLYDNLSEWHSLTTRMWMYAPVLAACVMMLVMRPAAERRETAS